MSLKVHACVGLPLFAGQTLIGALTTDGMDADRFDSFSDEELRLIAALVAGALNNALLIARLEAQNVLPAQAVNYPLPERREIIGLSGPMLQLKRDRYRRRLGFKRADQRRNRHRQRAGGEGSAPWIAASRQPSGVPQLRGAAGKRSGERAVRPCERGIYRGYQQPQR